MDFFEELGVSSTTDRGIDLEMTPDLAYRTFTCPGFHEEQCATKQRVLYCYIDAWETDPKLLLMEQGVKYARVLARIKAPLLSDGLGLYRQSRDQLDASPDLCH